MFNWNKIFFKKNINGFILCVLTMWVYFFLSTQNFAQTTSRVPIFHYSISSFLPFILGLMGGLSCSLGVALGNFFALIVLNSSLELAMLKSSAIFMFAYGGYRLWYARAEGKSPLLLYDKISALKFLLLLLWGCFNLATLDILIDPRIHSLTNVQEFTTVFANFFNLSLGLGICAIAFTYTISSKFNSPVKEVSIGKTWQWQWLLVVLLTLFNVVVAYYLCFVEFIDLAPRTGLVLACMQLLFGAGICTIAPQGTFWSKAQLETANRSLRTRLTRFILTMICLATYADIYVREVLSLNVYNANGSHYFSLDESVGYQTYIFSDLVECVIIFACFLWLVDYLLLDKIEGLRMICMSYLQDHQYCPQLFKKKSLFKDEVFILQDNIRITIESMQQAITSIKEADAQQEKAAAQKDIAEGIQQSLKTDFSKLNKELKNYKIKAFTRSYANIASDLINAFKLDNDHLILLNASVNSTGIAPALFMTVVQALVMRYSYLHDPAAILNRANKALVESNKEFMVLWTWLGVLELSTGKLDYVSAGYKTAFQKKMDGSALRQLNFQENSFVAVDGDAVYNQYTTVLEPQASLLVTNMGFILANNAQGEAFGENRLKRSFILANTAEDILRDLDMFTGTAQQEEDMNMLYLQRAPREEN